MKTNRSFRIPLLAIGLLALGAAPAARAQISLTTLGAPATQNFDSLAQTGTNVTWTDNSTIAGWYSTRTTYNSGTGASNAGALYSFGIAGTNPVTDRALGGIGSGGTGTFQWAARYVNNTGATITALDVTYNGEQWRDGGNATPVAQPITFQYQVANSGVITDADTPATGWTAVATLDFTSPIFTTTAGALDGNAAANRTSRTASISLSVAPGQEVWIRWTDINDAGNDHGLAIDDLSVTPQGGGPPVVNLSINDVALAEGNAGATNFVFTVSLSAPAGAGGVTFDIATANGTAVAPGDYTANSLTGQTIPAGSSTYAFTVQVVGDTTTEPNETFLVNVSGVTGATVADGQGQGTINNDDVTLTPIHDIQGPGNSSPIVGSSVSTRGVVTGVRANGFFIQEPNATVDADPATSEGVFVFTSSAPPAAAAVGNLVQVTATVAEFVPTQDVLQPPLTELVSPSAITLVTGGQPLPTAVTLTAVFPSPSGPYDQLERLEGMRVTAPSLTVTAPTLGSINEANATATTQGVLFATITGLPRAFREAGIQAPDPPPAGSGTIPPIPRFDTNPEVIRIDSDSLNGTTAIDAPTGAVILNATGPLDYTFRHYTIVPETSLSFTGGMSEAAVTARTATEVTIAAYNLQRFFDTVNDPAIGEPILTPAAFENRLFKASLGIRNYLGAPDIVGIVEMENLTTLQTLADRISTDAIAAGQPDPLYDAYLVEGNDVGGIDVGFLVRKDLVAGATPRVTVLSVTQENAAEQLVNPDSTFTLLNDRPPLVLDAVVNFPNGATYPVVVIVNHLRSLNDVNDETPGTNGWATAGARVRAKRHLQAVSLANLIQARQTADPSENIVALGDFNAFEVNDGYGHSMGTIQGTPAPDNQTAVAGDGADLVNPDLINLFDTPPPGERYSYLFDGNAQSLDHVLINSDVVSSTTARRIEHPRINADFPEVAKNVTTSVLRLADHDPVVGYFTVAAAGAIDLSITKTDSPDPVTAGLNLAYAITVTNPGPGGANAVSWSDTLPPGVTFFALPAVAGWSCTTPAVGAGGTVTCSNPFFTAGSAAFNLTVQLSPAIAAGTVLSNTATVTSTTLDSNTANNSATATTTVAARADIAVTKTDSPDPVGAGSNLTYTITVTNTGPSHAAAATLSDTLPAATTFVSLASPAGWSCTTPAVGAGGTVSCTNASFAFGPGVFTLVVNVIPTTPGSSISNTATVSTSTPENGSTGNNTATASTIVTAQPADLSIVKTATADPATAGENLVYTITLQNAGPAAASSASWADTLPAELTFVSMPAAPGWTCNTPPVGANGIVSCQNPSLPSGASSVFALTVAVNSAAAPGSTIANTVFAAASTTDPDIEDLTSTETVSVIAPASLSATKVAGGSTEPGGTLEYQIVITNDGPADQGDYAGDEFADQLPPELILTGATASSGTALANVGTNTVTWNGSIPAGGSVTIDIEATIDPAVAPDAQIANQGTLRWDGDGDGVNEQTGTTDDPGMGGGADPTVIIVGGGVPPVEVPVLDFRGLLILAALISAAAFFKLRR